MCGRYEIVISEAELREIIDVVQKKFPGEKLHTGEIFPTNNVPVLLYRDDTISPEIASWGFPQYSGKKGVIINARRETVEERLLFREAFLTQRCVVPASGFYEWTSQKPKQKYLLALPGLYMAGLAKNIGSSQRMVILTTAANSSIAQIHSRMPVLLSKAQIPDWLNNTVAARQIMAGTMPPLEGIAC
jgi:putative SOS response-associated peptidase YedK